MIIKYTAAIIGTDIIEKRKKLLPDASPASILGNRPMIRMAEKTKSPIGKNRSSHLGLPTTLLITSPMDLNFIVISPSIPLVPENAGHSRTLLRRSFYLQWRTFFPGCFKIPEPDYIFENQVHWEIKIHRFQFSLYANEIITVF